MVLMRFMSRYLQVPVVPNTAMPDLQLLEMLPSQSSAQERAAEGRVRAWVPGWF